MKYNVSGMSCSACVARVEKAVAAVEGVENVSVSLLTNSMIVEGNVDENEIVAAVIKAGYEANKAESGCKEELPDTGNRYFKLVVSFAFLAVLFFLEFNQNYFSGYGAEKSFYYRGILQGVVALIIILINRKYYSGGLKALLKGAPNMNTLVFVGSFTAFVYSMFSLVGHGDKLYFVTSGMILTFISIGKSLEESSKDKTMEAVRGLAKLAPSKAVLIEYEGDAKNFREVEVGELKAGNVVLVKAGNYFPADGIVVSGEGFSDESSLTGESTPVAKKPGDEVFTSTLLLEGELAVRAEKIGAETVLNSIIDMVTTAGADKAPIAKTADRVAAVFVPIVMGIALITFLAWFWGGSGAGFAIARAIAVLVVSCPCAMGLATPVAIMAGSGVGARYGILFKNAATLEVAGKAEIVALDKTGTLTEGKVDITENDVIKPDSFEAVSGMKQLNLEVVMISGDRKSVAEDIAEQAGIERVICEVKPGQKAEEVEKLKTGGRVMMVGDGINDSVALVTADVGVAIGTGKDVAIEAADIVLMKKSLLGVVDAIRLSRLTLRKIKQNLFWAFIYNIIGIPLAAGVLIPRFGIELPPMYSAAMMSISSLIVVLNALTINRFRATEVEGRNVPEKLKEKSIPEEVMRMKYTMNINGMMCAHCEARVKKCLEEIEGVEEAVVSHENNSAVVTAAENVSREMLSAAVTQQGYEVVDLEEITTIN